MNFKSFTKNLLALSLTGFFLSGEAMAQAALSNKYGDGFKARKNKALANHMKPKATVKQVAPKAKGFSFAKAEGDTLLFENFEGAAWPEGLQRLNVDGRPASANLLASFGSEAWIQTTSTETTGNNVAAATSWTNPVGTANRWMVTQPITLSGNYQLSWTGASRDPDFPDGYEVRICTNCPTDITNANVLSSFSTVLFEIDAETPDVPQSRAVSLAQYNGQTVRLAYRLVSTDAFVLEIDDILVSRIPSKDAVAEAILSPDTSLYDCAKTNFPAVVSVSNAGGETLYGVNVKLSADGPAQSMVEVTLDSLTANTTDTIVFPQGLNLSAVGNYTLSLLVTVTGDELPGNNTKTSLFVTRAGSTGAINEDFELLSQEEPLPLGWFSNSPFLPFNTGSGFGGGQSLGFALFNNNATFGTFNDALIATAKYANVPATATLSVKYLITNSTGEYQLADGDTVSVVVLKNCQPTAASVHIGASTQNPSASYQKLFIPLSDLNITPTDEISVELRAKAAPSTQLYFVEFDDVTMGEVANNDISLVNIETPSNTIIKRTHFQNFQIKGEVFNEGPTLVSPIRVEAVATPSPAIDTASITSLPGGVSKSFTTTPGFALAEAGDYTVNVTASIPGGNDPVPANNLVSFPLAISDSVMAKDLGDPFNDLGLGYGAGSGGKRVMANAITTVARDTLTSVSVFLGTIDEDCQAKAFFANLNAAGAWAEDSSATIVDITPDMSNSWVNLRFRLRTGNVAIRERGRAVLPNSTNLYGIKIRSGNIRTSFNFENTSDDGSLVWLSGQWLGTQDLTTGALTFFIRANFGRPIVSTSQLEQSLNYAELVPNPASGNSQLAIQMSKGQNLNIGLYSVEGRLINTVSAQASTGANRIDLPVAGLQKGLYLVKINADGFTTTKKLLVD